jgi:SulP family sulfate permease
MAGVLFLVAWSLIDFHHIRQILRAGHDEAVILIATFLATLFLNLEVAIMLGVILSLGFYLNRTSRPRVVTRVPDPTNARRKFTGNPDLPECPQLKIVRIDGSLFFGAVNHVQECLRSMEAGGQKHLMIVASGINFTDISGAEMLAQEARRRRSAGGSLSLIRVKDSVRKALDDGGQMEDLGTENLYFSKGEAIAAVYQHMDKDICRNCSRRIFLECSQVPERQAAAQQITPLPLSLNPA